MQENGIIIHFLIYPQCTGGQWGNQSWVYHPDNNVNPETEFLRSETTTEAFWQSLSKGKKKLFETQMSVLMKLIEESAQYDNIYYDMCHEPFAYSMSNEAKKDALEFFEEATKRFHHKYKEVSGGKEPILGIDTDFVPEGKMRDWIYSHDRFNIMIQGNNSEQFYTSPFQSVGLRDRYKKSFCPQESCDLPNLEHIATSGHPQNLSYFYPHHRTHLRKYVWRWVMAKSQLIDIYQKGMGNVSAEYAHLPDDDSLKQRMLKIKDNKEKYEPNGHNEFEKDALILRDFWNSLTDYPNFDFEGVVVQMHFKYVRRVLSSPKEAAIYISSQPGVEGFKFRPYNIKLMNLALADGEYKLDIWKPAAPGGIIKSYTVEVQDGTLLLSLDSFVDDIAIHIWNEN